MELKETEHNYYCSDNNFYVSGSNNFGRCDYDDFASFEEDWCDPDGTIDCDYNLCFSYDIKQKVDPETDEVIEGYELWLFFILQRKGIYRPVWIKNITKDDMPKLEELLKSQWEYMKSQWNEIN